MPVTQILTLDDAKAQLNLSNTNNDAELQVYVDAASDLIEELCGPVRQITVTDTVSGNAVGSVILLTTVPIVSLTSVTDGFGNPVDLTTVVFDGTAGTLKPQPNDTLDDAPYVVQYEAGRSVVPAAINLAARVIVQHLWRTQRGGTKRPGSGDESSGIAPGIGFAIPAMALELLSPFLVAPKVL